MIDRQAGQCKRCVTNSNSVLSCEVIFVYGEVQGRRVQKVLKEEDVTDVIEVEQSDAKKNDHMFSNSKLGPNTPHGIKELEKNCVE